MSTMPQRTHIRVLIAMVVVPAIGLAGCQAINDSKRITQRLDNLRRTVTMTEKLESEHPEKLDRLWGLLARRHEHDGTQAAKIPAELERALRQEASRWEKNLPIRERRIREMLQGNVGNIERTLPVMIF